MKIIAILEDDITVGGGFSQALNAILQMRHICEGRFDFEVFTMRHSNISYLEKLGLNAISLSFSILDKLIFNLSWIPWWQIIQRRLKLVGSFEKKLIHHRCDLVYFLTQSRTPAVLQRLNYITTVFDLCHRDYPEFPEVNNFLEFHRRECHFRNGLTPAIVVLTASNQLSDAVSKKYGVDRERCLSMPFSPSFLLSSALASDKKVVLDKYHLEEGYFFYPAQFWAHKNHIRILESLIILREKGVIPMIVFSGYDHGNRSYIENCIDRHNLFNQVKILGFVPADDMRGLYEGCCAVVMPTYFGPTNLPPIEAWMIGRPVIYSSHLKEQVGNAALYVNPDDAQELADAIQICNYGNKRMELIELGTLQLRQLDQQRADAEREFLARLVTFEARRRCWN